MPAAMRRLFGTPVPLTIEGSARPDRAASSCRATAAEAPSRSSSCRSSQSIGRRDTQVRPRRDVLELEHEADRRGAAADHHDVLVAEVLDVGVVGRVHVPAGEVGHAGVVRHERRAPRAGGVHEELRGDLVPRCGRHGGLLERLAASAEEALRLQLLHRLRRQVLVVDAAGRRPRSRPSARSSGAAPAGRSAPRTGRSSRPRPPWRAGCGRRCRSSARVSAMPGRSLTRCAVPSRSDDQRCCQAPPGPGARSSITKSSSATSSKRRR